VCGSGAVVCSWSLLFTAIIAVVRQKLHLSTFSNLRSRLSFGISGPEAMTIAAMAETLAKVLGIKLDVDWKPENPDRGRHIIINTGKAQRELLGWSPRIVFEQGCRLYAASIQSEQTADGRMRATQGSLLTR
jgi:nucleoside-diphosphate-sugar epimerase